jgi:hypothetical protein
MEFDGFMEKLARWLLFFKYMILMSNIGVKKSTRLLMG